VKKYFLFCIILTISHLGFAQNKNEKHVVQFSGMVLSSDSLEVLPYALIYDKTNGMGCYSNYSGFFTFAAAEGDSISFTYVGYKKKWVIIPKNLQDDRYTMVQLLTQDTLNLPVTVIRPYPKPEEFKKAFLELKVPDDDYDRAEKNLKKMSSPDLQLELPADGRENTATYLRNYAASNYYKGQIPPQNIFNPLAWAEFFKAWKRGDFKKKQYY
jgi:CarboxypepD_reg-like domain